jgi:hypothetical protein
MFLKLLRKKDTCAYKQGWDFEVIFEARAQGGGGRERERERIRTMMKIFIFLLFVFVFVNFFNCFLLYLFTSLLSFTIFQTSIIISFFFSPKDLLFLSSLRKEERWKIRASFAGLLNKCPTLLKKMKPFKLVFL